MRKCILQKQSCQKLEREKKPNLTVLIIDILISIKTYWLCLPSCIEKYLEKQLKWKSGAWGSVLGQISKNQSAHGQFILLQIHWIC